MKINKVKTKVDFIIQEHEILKFWEENEIFDKRRKLNSGKQPWSFIDGPITANNPMGVHHAWGRSLKDIYNRYRSMCGYELRYQNGFDCQGLWVEVEVEKELGFSSKYDIIEFGIEKFVNLCKERVVKYAKIQTEQSKRLGYWMDWENSYYTMSEENNYAIWGFLKKLWQENKIYKGNDVVPWSGRSGTSYSQMEIIEGRKLVSHRAVFVRFPIKEKKNEFLLIWTTTPWTLTSNVVAGVNVNLDYVKIRSEDGSIYYFANDNLEFPRLEKQFSDKKQWIDGVPKLKTIAQIFKERGGYEIIGTIKGSKMVGWEYKGPYDDFPAQKAKGGYPNSTNEDLNNNLSGVAQHRVIDPGKDSIGGDIVNSGEGTGIVHMAPGCGDIDHAIGKKLGLVNIAPLDDQAVFLDGFDWLTGLNATDKDTITKIIEDLKNRDFLLYVEEYPHVYPHCWRSGDELVFRLVDEWYINMDWRNKIKSVVGDINWIPAWGEDRENEWLDNMGDWMISKKRFWGLALPIWTFEDGSFYVVGSKKELKDLAVEGFDEFEGKTPHRPWIDKIKIKHPETNLIGTRIKDVGNPWLDAGIVPFSTLKYFEDKEYWSKWFPGDFVTECFPGQFRNWFYSLLAMSSELEGVAPFKTLLGHALVKDEEGKEMHKSTGNAIWFDEAAEKMGVDVMRWMYASQNVEHHLLFGYGQADEVRKKIITLWNVYSFYATYASLDEFSPENYRLRPENMTILDKWIMAKTEKLIKLARDCFDNYKISDLMKFFDIYLDDLSNWYIRRNRRRFWKSDNDEDKNTAYMTLFLVLSDVIKILSPVIPFVTEKIYQNLVRNSIKNSPESVHLCDFPTVDDKWTEDNLILEVDSMKKVIELGRSGRNESGIKVRQPLSTLYYALENDKIASFIERHDKIIKDELNVKTVIRINEDDDLISYKIKPNLKTLGPKYGKGLAEIRNLLDSNSANDLVKEMQSEEMINLRNGKYILYRQDVFIETIANDDSIAVSDQGITVSLVLELSDDLIEEGRVREIVRIIQNFRKDASFAVDDRIIICWNLGGKIKTAFSKFKEYFYEETLTIDIVEDLKEYDFEGRFKIDGREFLAKIKRK